MTLDQILQLAVHARFDPDVRDVLRDVLEERYGDAFTHYFVDLVQWPGSGAESRWPTRGSVLALMLNDDALTGFDADPRAPTPFYIAILHPRSGSSFDTIPTHGTIPDVIVATAPETDLTTVAYERADHAAGGTPSRFFSVTDPSQMYGAIEERAERTARERRERRAGEARYIQREIDQSRVLSARLRQERSPRSPGKRRR